MDWGTGLDLDSESILPHILPIHVHSNRNDEERSEIPADRSNIENMDSTAIAVKIKDEVEIGESFLRRSTDEENIQTVFPSGLILIHHQPTMTVSEPGSLTETHLLTYTPVYNDENGTPSFLQTSTPSSSVIRTSNSEIRFVRKAIQPISSGGTRLSVRLHYPPQDPLGITPPGQTSSSSEVVLPIKAKFTLTPNFLTGLKLETIEREAQEERKRRQDAENARRSRERERQSEASEQRKAKRAANLERKRKSMGNETPEHRSARLASDAERKKKSLANETPEQKNARVAVEAERRRQRIANETPERRAKRLAMNAERHRESFAKLTPDQRAKRIVANAERNRKKIVNLSVDLVRHF